MADENIEYESKILEEDLSTVQEDTFMFRSEHIIVTSVDSRYYEATKCKPTPFIITAVFNIISMEVEPEKSQKLFII